MQPMIKCVLTCVAVFCLFAAESSAQTTVLLRGSVKNNTSGAKVELTFTDETGSLVRASSASDGSYQTVLKAGHSYKVVISDDNLQRFTFTYEIPAMTKYAELSHDFTLMEKKPATEPVAVAKTKKKTKAKKSTKGK